MKGHGHNDVSHLKVTEMGKVNLSANVASTKGSLKFGAAALNPVPAFGTSPKVNSRQVNSPKP